MRAIDECAPSGSGTSADRRIADGSRMDQQVRDTSGHAITYDATRTGPRVLLLSDVHIVRYGLDVVLRAARSQWIITMSAAAADAIETPDEYDVVLLDMSMVDALESARELSARRHCRVVAFAAVDSDDALLAYVEAGIVGFVPREGSVADLIAAVEGALSGEARLSPRLTGTLMRRLAQLGSVRTPEPARASLTRREREILRLIDEGLSNKQIAARLTIELATVKNHVHHILEKTNARGRGEAAALLRRPHRAP
jgi:two-component system, NarL family, nitrate/nitrite response regulator NarL